MKNLVSRRLIILWNELIVISSNMYIYIYFHKIKLDGQDYLQIEKLTKLTLHVPLNFWIKKANLYNSNLSTISSSYTKFPIRKFPSSSAKNFPNAWKEARTMVRGWRSRSIGNSCGKARRTNDPLTDLDGAWLPVTRASARWPACDREARPLQGRL